MEMAKFCPECGSPLIESSKFCTNCGAKIPVISTDERTSVAQSETAQQPTHPSWYIPPVTKESATNQIPEQQGTKSTPKKRSPLEWIAICCGGAILLVIVAAFIAGMYQGVTSSSSSTDSVYNQDLSSMALTINDLPTGWETFGTAIDTNNHYNSEFLQVVGLTPYTVYQDITRNTSVDDAKASYSLRKGEVTQ